MRNPQRFEGLEEDEITWYSNKQCAHTPLKRGLEEDEITWYSNTPRLDRWPTDGLEEDKIA